MAFHLCNRKCAHSICGKPFPACTTTTAKAPTNFGAAAKGIEVSLSWFNSNAK